MKIWRNADGVAHVEGVNLEDAINGMGYAHGRDRAMQLLLMRILGQGRGSELLDAGDEMLKIDLFFRRMNWHAHMAEEMEKFPGDSLSLCQSYCDGVNTALSEKFPWEFKLLGYKPEPWTVEDILLMSRMMGYLTLAQSQGEMERLFVEMVQAGVSEEKLQDLFPGILGGMDLDLIRQIKLGERIMSPVSLWNIAAPVMMASNNWVVSGKKTLSGKPILCNDPHLELNRLPGVWYEMVIKTPDNYVMGGTVPGAPGFPVGRNSAMGWTATYTFMDATDSWIENCRDGHFFREPDGWLPFRKRTETILRKKKPPVDMVFYENDHGVLEGDPHQPGYRLTTAWASARSGALSIGNLLKILNAKTVAEGMGLLGLVETAWNFVLADNEGNIGYQMSGMMPKRRAGISGFVPLPGWKPENDWQGFESFEDLPRSINPECGFIVTTNQDLNHLGRMKPLNIMMGPYRADRISDLLSGKDRLTCEDMFNFHYDVYSRQAKAFMKILSPLLPDTPAGNILKTWDLCYDTESTGAWLFERFYKILHQEVFGDKGFGRAAVDHLDRHTGIFNDFYVNFDRVLLSENSVWFNGKTREEIYAKTVEKALMAEAPKKWGDDQKLMLTHILFDGKLPRFLGFDRGPVTVIGNRATVHQGQIYESAGRKTSFAPSYRMVTDFSKDEIFTNMAGGPSDRRFSKWYCSDLTNWETGKYKRLGPDAGEKTLKFP